MQTRSVVALRRGRPPKIAGTASRWWLYVSAEERRAAEQRAASEGVTLADVMRGYLAGYAAGTLATPRSAGEGA